MKMQARTQFIVDEAVAILKKNGTMRCEYIMNEIYQKYPKIPHGSIRGTVWNLEKRDKHVEKIGRGTYRYKKIQAKGIPIRCGCCGKII